MSESSSPIRRGRLRVYLGAAPGVGKTVAMLDEGDRREERGTDVVIGLVETHDRPFTAERIGDLEVVPRKQMDYRGTTFTEMDTDAIIARAPEVALIDELAHTNIPGSKHTKRWQDVNDILDAGIDVITTVNIQHLESLNDVVESITGIHQQETVPDAVVRAADQIQLVDMTPEALRKRLAHGNVYAPEKIDAALSNYFRVGNLGALRELALLWVADRADEALESYRRDQEITATWAARTRIVVALSGDKSGETLLRRGAVIAGRSEGRDLVAVHVVSSDGAKGSSPAVLDAQRQLAEELGASFHTVVGDHPADAVVDFARSINATLIIVGQSVRSRISTALRPSTSDLVVRQSGDIDVQVVTYGHNHRFTKAGKVRRGIGVRRVLLGLIAAVLLPVAISLIVSQLLPHIDTADLLLIMLLVTVVCTIIGGLWAALVAGVISVASADYFFVKPENEFHAASVQGATTLAVFLIVGGVITVIVNRSAAISMMSDKRRSEAEALAALSTNVLARSSNFSVALLEQICVAFGVEGAALFRKGTRGTSPILIESAGDAAITNLSECNVALDAGEHLVLGMKSRPLSASDQRLLAAYAVHASACLERDAVVRQSHDAARLQAIEAARNTVVTAVIQEFRDPVSRLDHALERLTSQDISMMSANQRNMLDSALTNNHRIDQLLADLLDANNLHLSIDKPDLRTVNLEEVLERAVRTSGHASRILTEMSDQIPRVTTDPQLLRRVLGILIEGASRRADPGTRIRIIVSVPPNRAHVEIRVVDRSAPPALPSETGRPIAVEGPKKLTVDSDGYGNSVARELAGVVGYTFETEPTAGGGMTVILGIPLDSVLPK